MNNYKKRMTGNKRVFVAPEVASSLLSKKQLNYDYTSADVFSLGMSMIEMMLLDNLSRVYSMKGNIDYNTIDQSL